MNKKSTAVFKRGALGTHGSTECLQETMGWALMPVHSCAKWHRIIFNVVHDDTLQTVMVLLVVVV